MMIRHGRITTNNSYNVGWSHEDGEVGLYNIDMNVMWRGVIGYNSILKVDVECTHELIKSKGSYYMDMEYLLNSTYNEEEEGCSPYVFMFRVKYNGDYHYNKLMYLIRLNCYGFNRWVLMDTCDIKSLKLHVPIFMGDSYGMHIDELDSVDTLISYIKRVTCMGYSITDSHSFNEVIGTIRGML